MSKRVFGLASVEIATIANDGDIGSSFSTIGETVAGTANMTSTDPTITDFKIEESDSPIESVVTDPAKITFVWSTYNVDGGTLEKLYGGTAVAAIIDRIATLGSITGGSSYTNGSYTGVALTGGTGSGATANITVSGGAVTAVTLVNKGTGYAAADSLSALAANIGGTGTGFAVAVATIEDVAASWEVSDTLPDIEKSLRLTDKKGNVVTIPRAKISGKLGLSFAKDKLGQIDITATVLQPTKSGVKRMKIVYA